MRCRLVALGTKELAECRLAEWGVENVVNLSQEVRLTDRVESASVVMNMVHVRWSIAKEKKSRATSFPISSNDPPEP